VSLLHSRLHLLHRVLLVFKVFLLLIARRRVFSTFYLKVSSLASMLGSTMLRRLGHIDNMLMRSYSNWRPVKRPC
jgi:hypothetical protein